MYVHYTYGVYCLFMYTWITSNFCKLGFFWGAPKFAEARETLRLQKDWIFSTFRGGHLIFLPWIVWPLVARLLSALRKNKCKLGNFTISNICELRACIMSSAIFVHLSPVYLSFLFLAPVYRVLSPDICQDWNLITVNCSQCLLILLCTSGKGYHMMATIKMPQQGRDCYCCNSQGILIFAIHSLFNFVIFFL